MQTDFESLFHEAEHHYLENNEIGLFRRHIQTMKERLGVYEKLREQEIPIFQAVADRLEAEFPKENPRLLERALKHWLAAVRYAAMAMLLNNPEYLRHRLLEWLTEQIQAYEMVEMEKTLYKFLDQEMLQNLEVEEYRLIQPFLEECQAHLLVPPVAAMIS
jgi:hypothetical protein